ncbi:MAG: NosD domain-containing protein [Candidatus Bathyarchaeia archaeon]
MALSFILLFVFELQTHNLATANFHSEFPLPDPAFTIKSDGSVDPSTAPIRRNGDIYTLTDNITGYTITIKRDNITLDGGGYTLQGTGIKAKNYGMELLNAGVYLQNRQGVTVRNMRISGFNVGIYMGTLFGDSSNNHFENNLLTENYYGISVGGSSCVFRNNVMENNTRNFNGGVKVDPRPLDLFVNDIDTSNTVDGKPIIYWVNKHGLTVPFDAGCVILVNCSDMTVQDLELSNNGHGIALFSTTNSLITKNNVTNSDSGMYIFDSSNLVISENNLNSNDNGIEARDSSNNNITSNSFTGNECGASFAGSQNNIIYENRFAASTRVAVRSNGLFNSTFAQNNIAGGNESGIELLYSGSNIITENRITGSGVGIRLTENSSLNMVSKNLIEDNKNGVLVRDSANNSIVGNMIAKNSGWGIQLTSNYLRSMNNLIYHNNFVENNNHGIQANVTANPDMQGSNYWDNGVEGNYWSDHNGGTPYFIVEGNKDIFPLLAPLEFNVPAVPMMEIERTSSEPLSIFVASAVALIAVFVIAIIAVKKNRK